MNTAEAIADYVERGYSLTKIANRNGTSPARVRSRLLGAGVELRTKRHTADNSVRDARIEKMLDDKRTHREIAARVGCSIVTIQAAVRARKAKTL